jgi:hypothetical protein
MPAKREKLKPGETLFGGRGVMIWYGNFGKKVAKDSRDSVQGAQENLAVDRTEVPQHVPADHTRGAFMNLVYGSCGCTDSGNELEDFDRFFWTSNEEESEKAFQRMIELCNSQVATQVAIIESNSSTLQFNSPYTFFVAWLKIPHQKFEGAGSPFDQLPGLAEADPSLRERLSELVVKLCAGGRDSAGEVSVDQDDCFEELDSLFD